MGAIERKGDGADRRARAPPPPPKISSSSSVRGGPRTRKRKSQDFSE